jgi:hypothetical protein
MEVQRFLKSLAGTHRAGAVQQLQQAPGRDGSRLEYDDALTVGFGQVALSDSVFALALSTTETGTAPFEIHLASRLNDGSMTWLS